MTSVEHQPTMPSEPEDIESVITRILDGSREAEVTPDLIQKVVVFCKNKQMWDVLVQIAGILREKGLASPDVVAAHLLGLRGMGLLEDALELLRGGQSDYPAILLQWTAILCEAGDFPEVISKLGPLDSDPNATPGELHALLAWSHLYSGESEDASKAVDLYRRLRDATALNLAPGQKSVESGHPAAYEGASRFHRDMRKLVHFWHQKGYAAALRRLPDRRGESQAEWQSLLDAVEPEIQPVDADPMMLRLAAQCYYHLKQYDLALQTFKRAIDTCVNLHRTQFEFALSLWSAVGARTALSQFKRAVIDLKQLSPLKRLGILQVTMFDLAQIVLTTEARHSTRGTGAICDLLLDATDEAAREVRSSLQDLAQRSVLVAKTITAQIRPRLSAQGDTGPMTVVGENRGPARIIGILDHSPRLCGLAEPVFERGDSRDRFFYSGTDANAAPVARPVSPETRIVSLHGVNLTSPAIRIVYLAAEALALLKQVGVLLPRRTSGEWQVLPREFAGVFAAMTINEGIEVLDGLSRRLAQYVVHSKLRSHETTARVSELCLAAARREDSIYVAALCYALTHGAAKVHSARRDLSLYGIPSEDKLIGFAERFSQIAEWIGKADACPASSSITKELTSRIVSRASEISGLRAADERRRQAQWAASEIRAILPETEDAEEKEFRIAYKLTGGTMVYLDDPTETLLLAKDPAFFCSTRSGDLSRPALDTLAFFKASDPKSLTHIASGTVTQKARSIRR